MTQANKPSVEYWLVLALGAMASGLFHALVAGVVWYYILQSIKPTDWELLTVASGFLGIATHRIIGMILRGGDPYSLIEDVIFLGAALMLVFRQRRGWVWFFLVVSSLLALLPPLAAALGVESNADVNWILSLIYVLWAWLLARWLRRTRKALITDRPRDSDARNA